MSLSTGTRLGPYEILTPLGAGGMGEVYKARDTRLDRTVAIKVLAEHLSQKPQLRERFEREARAVSSLNHSHICTLHDVGQQDDVDYLVMEYLEGDTLAQRLKKGPLPLDQALRYAVEIAGALDHAHRHGVVHRDLKPGNIMLTKAGAKVLDFGLAKVHAAAGTPDVTQPTNTLTEEGTILGTLQYMAPEQLEGKEADTRSDVFAFGAVAYEMATGQKAFEGKSRASVIAAIMHTEPAVAPEFQGPVEPVLRRCLAKDPDERWQNGSDLKWALENLREEKVAPVSRTPKLAWAAAGACLLLASVVTALWLRQPASEMRSLRLQVTPPSGAEFRPGITGGSAISPDGRLLAFVAAASGKVSLWVRPIDSLSARELPGTEGATLPFWSPDSKSLGFFTSDRLKRIDIAGGAPQVLCDATSGRGGTWGSGGVIVFARGIPGTPLQQVPASGGMPTPATTMEPGAQEVTHRSPQFLPGSRRFLYFVHTGRGDHGVNAGSLDDPHHRVRLVNTSYNASYAPGYLLWVRESALVAQRFDARTLRLEGEATPVVEDVGLNSGFFLADFSVSSTGVLLYGTGIGVKRQMVWTSRDGKALGVIGPPDLYQSPRLSPDGKSLVVTRADSSGNQNLWQVEFARGLLTRFTFDSGQDLTSAWSSDGRQIVFSSTRTGMINLYRKEASGAGREERLTEGDKPQYVSDWSRDGHFVLYGEISPLTGNDLWVLSMSGDRKPVPFLRTSFSELQGQFAPGPEGHPHWIAYTSNESGRNEVYVRAFPDSGAKWQVSTQGGVLPKWRGNGKELFYLSQGKLMAATVKEKTGALELETPQALFPASGQYDVTADGQRFLVLQPAEENKSQALTVVINWQAGLKR